MAEYIARDRFDTAEFTFESAGTYARPGYPATEHAQSAALEIGVDISAHRARRIDDVAQPDLVLGMDQSHLITARRTFPDLERGTILLLDHPSEIADPYGYDLETYRVARDAVVNALERAEVLR